MRSGWERFRANLVSLQQCVSHPLQGWLGLKKYQVRDYRRLIRHFIFVHCLNIYTNSLLLKHCRVRPKSANCRQHRLNNF